jgi:hypothetical protein
MDLQIYRFTYLRIYSRAKGEKAKGDLRIYLFTDLFNGERQNGKR